MRMPGFAAEASLKAASQSYRATARVYAGPRQSFSVAPAQPDLVILDESSGTSSESPHDDFCRLLVECCARGDQACCEVLQRHC